MTSRRILAGAVCSLALLATACSSESSSPGTTTTTTTVAETTTTVAATTTTVAATTTTVAETTTTAAPTTTTPKPVAGLTLSANGLGPALFDADADGVVSYVSSILGAPTEDSGWQAPTDVLATCPGTSVRLVNWNDLALFLTDDVSGVRHFGGYSYGPAFGDTINPYGLATDAGVAVGTTVAVLRGAYPTVTILPDDGTFGPTFALDSGISGVLTGVTDADTVRSFSAGIGCGE